MRNCRLLYERVVFVDADAVVLRDVGALFVLDRPQTA